MSPRTLALDARWLAVCVIVAAAAVFGVAWLVGRWSMEAAAQARGERAALQAELLQARSGAIPPCAAEVRYAAALPESVSVDKLAQAIHESAKAFGVSVISVDAEPHLASARTLGSLDVDIALRGPYPAVKSTLAEGLSRFASGVVRTAHFKRTAATQPVIVDADVRIAFALRPPALPISECRVISGEDVAGGFR